MLKIITSADGVHLLGQPRHRVINDLDQSARQYLEFFAGTSDSERLERTRSSIQSVSEGIARRQTFRQGTNKTSGYKDGWRRLQTSTGSLASRSSTTFHDGLSPAQSHPGRFPSRIGNKRAMTLHWPPIKGEFVKHVGISSEGWTNNSSSDYIQSEPIPSVGVERIRSQSAFAVSRPPVTTPLIGPKKDSCSDYEKYPDKGMISEEEEKRLQWSSPTLRRGGRRETVTSESASERPSVGVVRFEKQISPVVFLPNDVDNDESCEDEFHDGPTPALIPEQ